MKAKYINSREFYDAFVEEWKALISNNADIHGGTPWEDKTAWTEKMQASGGFLNRVMDRLASLGRPLYYKKEWYKVDALFVGGEDLYGEDHSYPSSVEVLIEHEFGEDTENEMWKLIHWRAPLKVMVLQTLLWVGSTLSRMVFKGGMRWKVRSCTGNCLG